MKIIKAGYEILTPINRMEILKNIEKIGRVCYKSEDRITDESAPKFVRMLIGRGHEAMIEHESLSVKFICDRGVSHELVRHRIASFAQESTRYCNYSSDKFNNEVTFIEPPYFLNCDGRAKVWWEAMKASEDAYLYLLSNEITAQEARSVLPNSLKTEVVMTANLREWRHFFKLRTAKAAHPQMREITIPLLRELQSLLPEIFDDIEVEQ